MWGEVQEFLLSISSVTWLVYLVATVIAFLAINNASYRITVGVWLMSDLVKIAVTPAMYSISEVSKEMARLMWYPRVCKKICVSGILPNSLEGIKNANYRPITGSAVS